MKKKIVVLAASMAVIFAMGLAAHPGRLDSHGGHWDHKKKTYHYHRNGKIVVDRSKKWSDRNKSEKKIYSKKKTTAKKTTVKKRPSSKKKVVKKKSSRKKIVKKTSKKRTYKSRKKKAEKKS